MEQTLSVLGTGKENLTKVMTVTEQNSNGNHKNYARQQGKVTSLLET